MRSTCSCTTCIVYEIGRAHVWTPANFFSFALILTKNNAAEKKFEKKNFRNIWKLSDKVLTFAHAFVEKQFKNWLPDRNGAKNVFFFFYLPFDKRDDEKKEKRKKTSENIWKIYLKVFTFASAFWKEKQFKKEAIFEEFT